VPIGVMLMMKLSMIDMILYADSFLSFLSKILTDLPTDFSNEPKLEVTQFYGWDTAGTTTNSSNFYSFNF
ncbi:MAG: hypothetical protein KBD83_09295, partial [Gammaproteobacteria bacterium]|nr:hypothetical protein [Gammaproteobacteria bacterium]